ncbi:hypothetical protein ACFPRL_15915 [Pseudoclavibacter helvolus]
MALHLPVNPRRTTGTTRPRRPTGRSRDRDRVRVKVKVKNRDTRRTRTPGDTRPATVTLRHPSSSHRHSSRVATRLPPAPPTGSPAPTRRRGPQRRDSSSPSRRSATSSPSRPTASG